MARNRKAPTQSGVITQTEAPTDTTHVNTPFGAIDADAAELTDLRRLGLDIDYARESESDETPEANESADTDENEGSAD